MNLELEFLKAAHALTRCQREIDPLVASALGRPTYEYWIVGNGRSDDTLSSLKTTVDGEWRFYFHGLEYDAKHISDGRHVRVDFAPGGALAFTPGGVGSFVMRSREPWPVFEELRSALRNSSGYDYWRCARWCGALRAQGLLQYSRPDLVELIRANTRFVPGKGNVIDVSGLDLGTEEIGLAVCDTLVLTAQGERAVLESKHEGP